MILYACGYSANWAENHEMHVSCNLYCIRESSEGKHFYGFVNNFKCFSVKFSVVLDSF